MRYFHTSYKCRNALYGNVPTWLSSGGGGGVGSELGSGAGGDGGGGPSGSGGLLLSCIII